MDHKTALTKLLSIFDSSSVSLGAEGKRLRDLLDEIKARENAVKVVVLLGESRVGKSSIGNCLLSLYSVEGFAVSRRTDSCTKTTSDISVALITNRSKCIIIDTPGLNDSLIENTDHIRGSSYDNEGRWIASSW